jgi:hypothetical protein
MDAAIAGNTSPLPLHCQLFVLSTVPSIGGAALASNTLTVFLSVLVDMVFSCRSIAMGSTAL